MASRPISSVSFVPPAAASPAPVDPKSADVTQAAVKAVKHTPHFLRSRRANEYKEASGANNTIPLPAIVELNSYLAQVRFCLALSQTISTIKKDDICDSFRAFLAPDCPIDVAYFTLNGQPLYCPDLGASEGIERKKLFMTWLINQLNRFFPKSRPISVKDQAALLCSNAIPEREQITLIANLDFLLDKHGREIHMIPKILHDLKNCCSVDFCTWAQKHFESLLKKNDPKPTGKSIIEEFENFTWLELCVHHIPCMRILQSLSFGAFGKATALLQGKFYPHLFHQDPSTVRIKSFPTAITHFSIDIHPINNSFFVTHHKLLRLIKGSTDQFVSFGSLMAHLRLGGCGKNPFFSSMLKCQDVQLNSDLLPEIVQEIAKQLRSIPFLA